MRAATFGASGTTELLRPSGFDGAQARTGVGGKVFGVASGTAIVWDVSEAAAQGGC